MHAHVCKRGAAHCAQAPIYDAPQAGAKTRLGDRRARRRCHWVASPTSLHEPKRHCTPEGMFNRRPKPVSMTPSKHCRSLSMKHCAARASKLAKAARTWVAQGRDRAAHGAPQQRHLVCIYIILYTHICMHIYLGGIRRVNGREFISQAAGWNRRSLIAPLCGQQLSSAGRPGRPGRASRATGALRAQRARSTPNGRDSRAAGWFSPLAFGGWFSATGFRHWFS